jgi:hypothetical protein
VAAVSQSIGTDSFDWATATGGTSDERLIAKAALKWSGEAPSAATIHKINETCWFPRSDPLKIFTRRA